ncbi:proteasome subunit beta type-1-like [Tropilaelaps mercedesae]|uniref:Proteasome subunit beta type-1-like n=1 Tax=Tropilaelaps mercedesae TaxID=418985 RepID=A0A1V9XFB9_9ACAR|nr:proteasome subunit beta type-1-like [Tropilaelaps mercedesae]
MTMIRDQTPEITSSGLVQRHGFNPYEDNGGSLAAIAGEDFAAIAADTRLCIGYQILTRNLSRLFKLTNNTVWASSGCWCDCLMFNKYLEARLKMYNYEHDQNMSTTAVAQCCATMLYARRFFPYYAWTLLAGLTETGKGVVYSYDPVGHMEMKPYAAAGSASGLLLPPLDSIVGKKNQSNPDSTLVTRAQAVTLLKDIFISAAERDINCGDSVQIMIISKDGIEELREKLRED